MSLRTITVTEACKETGIARASMYRLLETGAVAGNRVGNRWRVNVVSLEQFVSATPSKPVSGESLHDPENPFL